MQIKPQKTALMMMGVGILGASAFVITGFYAWNEALHIAKLGWIPLLLTLLSLVLIVGGKPFASVGKQEKKQGYWLSWGLRVVKTQLVFIFIILALSAISVCSYVDVAPEIKKSPPALFAEFIMTKPLIWLFYPFALSSLFAILFGGVASSDEPKVGNTISILLNKKFSSFVKAFLDFSSITGLFLGFFFLASLLAILVANLVGYFFNIDMHFGLTYRTAAIGFLFSYVPFTDMWKGMIYELVRVKRFSPGVIFIILGVGIGLLLPFFIKLIGWFIGTILQQDLTRTFPFPILLTIEPLSDLSLMVWTVCVFAAPWWGMQLARMSYGYKVWEFLLIFSVTPLILYGGIFLIRAVKPPDFMELSVLPLLEFPGAVVGGLIVCFIVFSLLQEKSGWLESLFLILPNQIKQKSGRMKQIIGFSASWVLYLMLIWIYVGMFAVQGIFLGFLLSALVSVTLIMIGVQRVVWMRFIQLKHR